MLHKPHPRKELLEYQIHIHKRRLTGDRFHHSSKYKLCFYLFEPAETDPGCHKCVSALTHEGPNVKIMRIAVSKDGRIRNRGTFQKAETYVCRE